MTTDASNSLPHPPAKIGSNQHTVPRLLLRPFVAKTPKGHRVFVFDRNTRSLSTESIKTLTAIPGFYDSPQNPSDSLDGCITGLENSAGAIIARIRKSKTFPHMTTREQKILALFVATQYCRTITVRDALEKMHAGTNDAKTGKLIPDAQRWFLEDYPGQSPVDVQLSWLARWAFDLASLLFMKVWVLLRSSGLERFITTDTAVIINYFTPSNDATAILEEADFYLPLSPQLCLTMQGPQSSARKLDPINFSGFTNQICSAYASIDDPELTRLNQLNAGLAHRFAMANDEQVLRRAVLLLEETPPQT